MYRLEQQAAPSRREFDLYDPESKKKDKPARVSDDDPRCQVSGLQAFQGAGLKFILELRKISLSTVLLMEIMDRIPDQPFQIQAMDSSSFSYYSTLLNFIH